jgi:hypothetical protein
MVPNIFHFIFGLRPDFGEKPFSLIHYLAIASCHAVNRPDAIHLYYSHEPSGVWWERAKPYVHAVQVEPPAEIWGRPLVHYAHKADVLRLNILRERGGVYLDMDVVSIRPFRELFSHDTVLGREYGRGLCNAVILATPSAAFIERWYREYESFVETQWSEHSVSVPARLAAEYPATIHVVDHRKFFWPRYTRGDMRRFLMHPGSQFCAESFCVHLWETVTWPWLGRLTPWHVYVVESEFCRLARPYFDRECLGGADLDRQRTTISEMRPECREALILCEFQELPAAKAARMLGCTEEALSQRLEAARAHLSGAMSSVERQDLPSSHAQPFD